MKTIYNSTPEDLMENDFFGLTREEYVARIVDYMQDVCINPASIAKKNWNRAIELKEKVTSSS